MREIGQGNFFLPEIPLVFWLNRDAWPGFFFYFVFCVLCTFVCLYRRFLFFTMKLSVCLQFISFNIPLVFSPFFRKQLEPKISSPELPRNGNLWHTSAIKWVSAKLWNVRFISIIICKITVVSWRLWFLPGKSITSQLSSLKVKIHFNLTFPVRSWHLSVPSY